MKSNFRYLIPAIPILFLLFYNNIIANFYIKLLIMLTTIALLSYNAYKNKEIKNSKLLVVFLILSLIITVFFLINF